MNLHFVNILSFVWCSANKVNLSALHLKGGSDYVSLLAAAHSSAARFISSRQFLQISFPP